MAVFIGTAPEVADTGKSLSHEDEKSWFIWTAPPVRGEVRPAALVVPGEWLHGADSVHVTIVPAEGRKGWFAAATSCDTIAEPRDRSDSTHVLAGSSSRNARLVGSPQVRDSLLSICLESGGVGADQVTILNRRFVAGKPTGLRIELVTVTGQGISSSFWERPVALLLFGGLISLVSAALATWLSYRSALRLKEAEWTGELLERLDQQILEASRLLQQFLNNGQDAPGLPAGGYAYVSRTKPLKRHLLRQRGSEYLKRLDRLYQEIRKYNARRAIFIRSKPAERPPLLLDLQNSAGDVVAALDALSSD